MPKDLKHMHETFTALVQQLRDHVLSLPRNEASKAAIAIVDAVNNMSKGYENIEAMIGFLSEIEAIANLPAFETLKKEVASFRTAKNADTGEYDWQPYMRAKKSTRANYLPSLAFGAVAAVGATIGFASHVAQQNHAPERARISQRMSELEPEVQGANDVTDQLLDGAGIVHDKIALLKNVTTMKIGGNVIPLDERTRGVLERHIEALKELQDLKIENMSHDFLGERAVGIAITLLFAAAAAAAAANVHTEVSKKIQYNEEVQVDIDRAISESLRKIMMHNVGYSQVAKAIHHR